MRSHCLEDRRRRPRFMRLAPLLLGFHLAACGAGEPRTGGWAGTMDTLANGVVRVGNPASGMWVPEDAWRIEEELRIGTATGEGPELFGTVTDLEVDDLGRIYVLDRQAHEVRVFNAAGAYVRTIGRQGAGPGEFNAPVGLAWGGDGNLWIADPQNSRYSVFDTAGTYVTSHHRPIAGLIMPWPGGIDHEGRLFDQAFGPNGRRLLRFDSLMQPVDTFALPTYESPLEAFTIRNEDGRTRVAAWVPFGPYLVTYIDPRGFLWFGANEEYRIVQQRLGGDTLRVVERAYEPVPVTGEDRDEAIEGLEWFTRQGGTVDPSRIPDVKPAFEDLVVDDQGFLWVRPSTRREDGSRFFDVFDPDGRYLGGVRSNVDIISAPLIRGDLVYGVTRDEFDVPYVVRARIVGRNELHAAVVDPD